MVSLKHSVTVTVPNNPDKEVGADAWNAEHVITGTAGKLMGFSPDPEATEITVGNGLVLDNGRIDATADMVAANNLSDLADASTARTNLGLGSAAQADSTDFATADHNHDGVYAPISHTHAISDVTGLQDALDAKLDDSQATTAGLALLGAADVAAQLTALGLGNAATMAAEWALNFTSAGDVYIPAIVAMTIDQGNAKIGTGTLAYEKSTNAAPGTFSSTTLPATLEAGAWLKVSASSVTGFVATHLKRTA